MQYSLHFLSDRCNLTSSNCYLVVALDMALNWPWPLKPSKAFMQHSCLAVLWCWYMKMRIKDLDQWLVKVVFSRIFIYSNIFYVQSPVFGEVTLCLIISYASLGQVIMWYVFNHTIIIGSCPIHKETISSMQQDQCWFY